MGLQGQQQGETLLLPDSEQTEGSSVAGIWQGLQPLERGCLTKVTAIPEEHSHWENHDLT